MKQLQGTVIIITGSSSGLGRAMAIEYGRLGAKVVCAGRRLCRLNEVVRTIEANGGTAMPFQLDVNDEAQVNALPEECIKKFGRIDMLINNAGVYSAIGLFWEVVTEDLLQDISTNLIGTVLCTKAVLPYMREQKTGLVINITGGGDTEPLPGASGYGTAKAAIVRFTGIVAEELKDENIPVRMCAINPGTFVSEMTQCVARKGKPGNFMEQYIQNGFTAEEKAKKVIKMIAEIQPEHHGRRLSVRRRDMIQLNAQIMLERIPAFFYRAKRLLGL